MLPPLGSVIPPDKYSQYFVGLNDIRSAQLMKLFSRNFYTHGGYGKSALYGWECNNTITEEPTEEVLIFFIKRWNDTLIECKYDVNQCLIVYWNRNNWCAEFVDDECEEGGPNIIRFLSDGEINQLFLLIYHAGCTVAENGL